MAANRNRYSWPVLLLAMLFAATVQARPAVQINGLLPNQAIVTIDGQQRVLKTGQTSLEGVTLVAADSKRAVLEWKGERFEVALSKQIASSFSARPKDSETRIVRGENNHYFATGHINGKVVRFLVDTGASSIAMTKDEADRLGIDWRNAPRLMSSTAGGMVPYHRVVLGSVTVGSITQHNVEASVLVSTPMEEILLGMTFLSHTEMREEDNTLVLRKKF